MQDWPEMDVEIDRKRLQKLESGELKRTPGNEKGITALPLFDCIEPKDWMVPILHAVDLEVNAPFHYLQRYVWNRVEDIPVELILARDAKADASNAVDDCWAEVLEAEQYENEMEIELHQICPEDDMVFDDSTMKTMTPNINSRRLFLMLLRN